MDRGREGRDHKRQGARCQRGGWMDRQTMGTVDLAEALHIIMDVEEPLKAEPADSSHRRHSPTHLHFAFCPSFQLFFGIFISPGSLFPTHTHRTASPFELSPPGSRGEGGQSGIYVLQFIFVLEAPRRLSSMLA